MGRSIETLRRPTEEKVIDRMALDEALSVLNSRGCKAMILRYGYERTLADIGEEMGVSPGRVHELAGLSLSRARRAARKI